MGLLIAASYLFWQARQSARPQFILMPEDEGAISTIALQYTRESASFSEPCYRAFLKQIDPNVEILVVCGNKDEADGFRRVAEIWHITNPRRIHTIVVGALITGWCKDRFLVGRGSPGMLIHAPVRETGLASRNHDSLVAPAIAHYSPQRFSAVEVPLHFDAGDILATRSHIIVSDVLWRKNGSPPDFRARLERLFGKEIVWLKGVPQHHIGMFAAPLDDHTVVVGDPTLAKGTAIPYADFSKKATEPFHRAAEQLARAGFRVLRVPTVVFAPQVYMSYTNAVFDTRGSKRIVFMPVYDQPTLDHQAIAVYQKANWQVRPIPVRTVYKFRGTIGCLINVLERR